jgi:polar amino acid transport system permease protein
MRALLLNLLALLLLGAAVAGVCVPVLAQLDESWSWAKAWEYRELLWQGWKTTLWLSLGALVGTTLVGLVLMFGQRSGLVVVRWFCLALTEIVRCTPLLVQLLIGYFLIFSPLQVESKTLIGMVLLSLFGGAYLSEILRGAVESLPQAQIDSARAVGFSRGQIYRYVIFPQALRRVRPAVAGQFVSLIKDSSLLSVIGVEEFAYQAQVYSSMTYGGIEAYLPLAVGYLVLTLPIAWLARWLERRGKEGK